MMTLSEIIKHVSYHSPSLRQSPSLCHSLQQWTFIFYLTYYIYLYLSKLITTLWTSINVRIENLESDSLRSQSKLLVRTRSAESDCQKNQFTVISQCFNFQIHLQVLSGQ